MGTMIFKSNLAAIALVLSLHAYGADRGLERYPNQNIDSLRFAMDLAGVVQSTFEEHFPLMLQVRVDPTFSDQQIQIIKKASQVFVERALSSEVIDCAYARSSKDMPRSRQDFELELFAALSLVHSGGMSFPVYGFIARMWDQSSIVGLAYVNVFHSRSNPLPGYGERHHFHIALNSDYMGSGASYFYRNNAQYWAGVIAHEFLHNLGYRHPTGYEGSFINEYGECIASGGAEPEYLIGLKDVTVEPTACGVQ